MPPEIKPSSTKNESRLQVSDAVPRADDLRDMPALLASKKSYVRLSSWSMLRRCFFHWKQWVVLVGITFALGLLVIYSQAAPPSPEIIESRLWFTQIDPSQISSGRLVVTDTSGEEDIDQNQEGLQVGTQGQNANAVNTDPNNGEVQANNGEVPANNGELPANNGELQANNGGPQVNNGELPVNNRELQANNGEVQVNNRELPANNGEPQVNNGELPVNNGELQANNGEPQAGIQEQGNIGQEKQDGGADQPLWGQVEGDTYESTGDTVESEVLSKEPQQIVDEDSQYKAVSLPEPFRQPGPSPTYTNLMNVDPPPYLKNYAAPCWMEELNTSYPYNQSVHYAKSQYNSTFQEMEGHFKQRLSHGENWRLRCLPAFYIAGLTKCGTSELFQKLNYHPHVIQGPFKEPHYWSRLRTGWLSNRGYVPISNFVDMYDKAAEEVRRNVVTDPSTGKAFHPVIFGEGSVTTFFEDDFWRNLPENEGRKADPKFHISQYLLHIQPKAKIIITTRNPTDRLYSDYVFFGTEQKSPEHFHKAVEDAIRQFRACLDTRALWDCITDRDLMKDPVWKFQTHIRTGLYVVHMEKWFKFLPRDQFYVSRLENFAKHRIVVLNDICKFLGIGPLTDAIAKEIERAPLWNNQVKKKSTLGPMWNQTRVLLDDFYRPYNQRLAGLLKDPGFLWEKS